MSERVWICYSQPVFRMGKRQRLFPDKGYSTAEEAWKAQEAAGGRLTRQELGRIGYGVEIWTGQAYQGEKPTISKQVMK